MLKQQNKPGESDLEERGDKAEGWDCWDRGRVGGRENPNTSRMFKLAALFRN